MIKKYFLFILFMPAMAQLVEVKEVIPNIELEIKYATSDNFTGQKVYDSDRCYLLDLVVSELVKVQQDLKKMNLGLKIFDGFRPFYVQEKFWAIPSARPFLADPRRGGKHTRGTAVDLTLIDLETKKELDMPSGFDEFTERAASDYQGATELQKKNRGILQAVMERHNFQRIKSEWWHFDYKDWQQYPVIK